MIEIQENVILAPYTSFYIGGPASYFVEAKSIDDITEALEFVKIHQLPIFVLGGGSNVLISDAGFTGLVLHPALLGITVVSQTPTEVILEVGSGESWDSVVAHAVSEGWWGIENLSHIPGLTGALAVQNVGAYGQEASSVVETVRVYDINTAKVFEISKQECIFGYRSSIFNTTHKNKYIILSTTFRLQKSGTPNLNYGDLIEYFSSRGVKEPTQQQVRQAIIEIRERKYPYPDSPSHGSIGSFFRGKSLTENEFVLLSQKVENIFGGIAANKLEEMKNKLRVPQGYKTPTAFLIELCGLKGFQIGGAKVQETQAAVIMNTTGNATSADVLAVFNHVKKVVQQKTGVALHHEPEFIGFS